MVSDLNVVLTLFIFTLMGALFYWLVTPGGYEVAAGTLVAIRSRQNGRFIEVSAADGMLRATANTTTPSTRFRMATVSASTVQQLRELHDKFERRSHEMGREGASIHTRSGCDCSGFSSEHGFGRYCYAWEAAYQDSWCYVADSCTGRSVRKGSFGRRYDLCTSAPYPSPPPSPQPAPPSPPPPPLRSPPPPFDARKARGTWVPPAGCECSGFSNRHGFGAHCFAWEAKLAPTQLPWCYVNDNCTAGVRRGSFGRPHADCTLVPYPPPPPASKSSWFFGRRLHPEVGGGVSRMRRAFNRSTVFKSISGTMIPAKKVTYPTKKLAKSHAHEREEAVLLKKIERLRRKYVTFVSEATQGFLTVDMPPHKHALFPVALSDKLSLQAVFALLPSGHIAALGTNALLNLCEPRAPAPLAPSTAFDYHNDRLHFPTATPPPSSPPAPTLCTGYRATKGDPHYKLLRVTSAKEAEFTISKLKL
ncbi:hypothetical protein AB1Y20_004458 [Prymnesium parvum]|uniref:Kringle domain-containing protein n=1 Tax=Prymnesium parvum TaxID=97485 RepID=A0AB34IYH6_PRYPA